MKFFDLSITVHHKLGSSLLVAEVDMYDHASSKPGDPLPLWGRTALTLPRGRESVDFDGWAATALESPELLHALSRAARTACIAYDHSDDIEGAGDTRM